MNPAASKNHSRLAVLTAFFIYGAIFATWYARIPAIREKLALSEGQLGLVLLGISVGMLTALSVAGGMIAKFGSPKVTLAGAAVLVISLPFLALTPSAWALWLQLFIFGAAGSTIDVAVNEQAVLVERNAGKPLMSSFHAAFSVGGLAGSLIGAGMASINTLSPFVHFLISAILFGLAMLLAYPHLLPVETNTEENGSVFRLPERALWLLGFVTFCSSIGQGATADWSAVYLTQVLETNAAFAALGFAAYSLTMTLGRVFGDALAAVWKPVTIVRFGGVVAALGFLAAMFTTSSWVALLGFAAIGLGLANIIPLSFSAAGNYPGISTSVGLAGVATIGYAGFLIGPPLIGLIAEAISLRIAFIFVTLLVGTMIFTAKAISPR